MNKKRLGGWLLVFYIGLILSLILLTFSVIGSIFIVIESPQIIFSIIVSVISFIIILKLVIQINRREKEVMKTLLWLFGILAISAMVEFTIGVSLGEMSLSYFLRAAIYILIWKHYFSTTKRVKETFGVNLGGKIKKKSKKRKK